MKGEPELEFWGGREEEGKCGCAAQVTLNPTRKPRSVLTYATALPSPELINSTAYCTGL